MQKKMPMFQVRRAKFEEIRIARRAFHLSHLFHLREWNNSKSRTGQKSGKKSGRS